MSDRKYRSIQAQLLRNFSIKAINTGFFCRILLIFISTIQCEGGFKAPSDPKYLIIFGSIAILIVVIAAINFMNLATAQASRRAKEVGIKKIGGSTRGMLITQFLSESFILAFISLIFALIMIKA